MFCSYPTGAVRGPEVTSVSYTQTNVSYHNNIEFNWIQPFKFNQINKWNKQNLLKPKHDINFQQPHIAQVGGGSQEHDKSIPDGRCDWRLVALRVENQNAAHATHNLFPGS